MSKRVFTGLQVSLGDQVNPQTGTSLGGANADADVSMVSASYLHSMESPLKCTQKIRVCEWVTHGLRSFPVVPLKMDQNECLDLMWKHWQALLSKTTSKYAFWDVFLTLITEIFSHREDILSCVYAGFLTTEEKQSTHKVPQVATGRYTIIACPIGGSICPCKSH